MISIEVVHNMSPSPTTLIPTIMYIIRGLSDYFTLLLECDDAVIKDDVSTHSSKCSPRALAVLHMSLANCCNVHLYKLYIYNIHTYYIIYIFIYIYSTLMRKVIPESAEK